MKTKVILSLFVATLFAFLAVSSVMAETLSIDQDSIRVEINDMALGNTTTLAGYPGESVDIRIQFMSNAESQDLKVKAWIDGYKNDITASTARFDVVANSSYSKTLSLTLPTVKDLEDNPESIKLYVSIADKNDEVEKTYRISMERDSYSLDLLSVEAPMKALAGEIIAIDVVLKNIGGREAEDTFVVASIPELGVYKKAYFGDLTPKDNADEDKEDARERILYLVVPSDAKSGDYAIDVKASNYDTTSTARKVITIAGTAATQTNNGTATNIAPSNGSKMPTSIIVLTVVLVIIFVVLLVVLIVLLTKKPSEKIEDFGETSYY